MKYTTVFVLAIIAGSYIKTELTSNKVVRCLQSISPDGGFIGQYAKTNVVSPTERNVEVKKRNMKNKGRMLNSIIVRETPGSITSLLKSYFAMSESVQKAIKK